MSHFDIEPLRDWQKVVNLNVPCRLEIDDEGIAYNENGTALFRLVPVGEPAPRWQVQPLRTLGADVPKDPR